MSNLFISLSGAVTPLWVVSLLLNVMGRFFLFGKCGQHPAFAFIPFVSSYYLGVCGEKKRDGKVLLVTEIAAAVLTLVFHFKGSVMPEPARYIGAGVALAILIAELVFSLRIWRGLCLVFGKKRRWMFLWFVSSGLTALLWGLKDEYQPVLRDSSDGRWEVERARSESIFSPHRRRVIMEAADQDFLKRISKGGRISQIGSSLWRLLKDFVFQNDWMVLPLSAIIIGAIAFVVRNDLFLTMEGTLKGIYALTILAIWNGCFHSLQAIVRDRKALIEGKRVGIHYTSYLFAQMIYQALLCLGQTALVLYIFYAVGIRFPEHGLFMESFALELGITIFLLTYCADMLGLLISSVAPSNGSAMTVMPFILVAQFVFAGGILPLPAWCEPIEALMPSHYGAAAIGAQGNYNALPMVTGWELLNSVRDYEIGGSFTLQDGLDFLSGEAAEDVAYGDTLKRLRATLIVKEMTLNEIFEMLRTSKELESFRNKKVLSLFTVGDLLEAIENTGGIGPMGKLTVGKNITVGDAIDFMRENPDMESIRTRKLTLKLTLGRIIDAFGADALKDLIVNKTAEAARIEQFNRNRENLSTAWSRLGLFALAYVLITLLALEIVCRGLVRDEERLSGT